MWCHRSGLGPLDFHGTNPLNKKLLHSTELNSTPLQINQESHGFFGRVLLMDMLDMFDIG